MMPTYWQTPKICEFAQTGDCTRHKARVAIEALGGPHEYLGAPKDPFSGGFLGAPGKSWGPPRALMRCLTSIATLTSCLVQPPVQLGKFTDFWGLPISWCHIACKMRKFNSFQNF